MSVSPAQLTRIHKLLLQAEREYTPAAYARALEAVESLPNQDSIPARFYRATIQHAMAEFRGDLNMMREVLAEYERIHATGVMDRMLGGLFPELIDDCRRQVREGEQGLHGWEERPRR